MNVSRTAFLAAAILGCGNLCATEISDVVKVEGKEWAQPVLFAGITWNEINGTCPAESGGVCDGTLSSVDVSGFTWASVDELNVLLNSFLDDAGVPQVDQLEGPDRYTRNTIDSEWAPAVFDAGFIPTESVIAWDRLGGWTRTLISENRASDRAYTGGLLDAKVNVPNARDIMGSSIDWNIFSPMQFGGGSWFYRETPNMVGAPPVLLLLGLGLAVIGFSRARGGASSV